MHDFVLFMVNTGLRPDEAWQLEFRDVEIVRDARSKQTVLEMSVRGKRGVGYCKSMPGAVLPFERLHDRVRPSDADGCRHRRTGEKAEGEPNSDTTPGPTERLFPHRHWELWNKVLDELSEKRIGKAMPGRPTAFAAFTFPCV
jgi:integrase